MTRKISALIICGDRLDEVTRCLASLDKLGELLHEVLLLKNAPKHPWRDNCFDSVPSAVRNRLHIISTDTQVFPTTGRNRLAAQATGSVYLFLDDDSLVLERQGIEDGLRILQNDPQVGSIAYPQSTDDGKLAPFAQPAPVEHACFTCGFMTCAAMTRADVYHKIGGFQELLQMAHEENEFCKRQWNAGYAVLYLPERCICHNPSPNARNSRQRAMLNARNIWYQAVLHEPLWLLAGTLLPRLFQGARYLRCADEWTGGNWRPLFQQALGDFRRDLPQLWQARRPLKWATIRRWQQLKQHFPPYAPQHSAADKPSQTNMQISETVVLGAINHHEWPVVAPWIRSLRGTGYRGRVILVAYEDIDEQVITEMSRENVEIHRASMEISVNRCRFKDFEIILRDMAPNTLVIATDVRDVVFQTNPSALGELLDASSGTDLAVSSEGWRYQDSEWNLRTLRNVFPAHEAALLNEEVYCSGVIVGTAAAMTELSARIWEISRVAPSFNGDQVAMNIMLREQDFVRRVRRLDVNDGRIFHARATWIRRSQGVPAKAEPCFYLFLGFAFKADGAPVCVLHQYTENTLERVRVLLRHGCLLTSLTHRLKQRFHPADDSNVYWKNQPAVPAVTPSAP